MKNFLSVLFILACFTFFSQTYNSGDKELDGILTTMNTDAKTDLAQIKNNFASTY
ncbi:MAG: hypothetical protein RIT43_2422, partial [Bacteroidota bacterium]